MTLARLIEAVEIGNEAAAKLEARKAYPEHAPDMGRAYNGSLDAAKRLHDALLPGWGGAAGYDFYTGMCRSTARVSHMGKSYGACVDDPAQVPRPARAWLLSVLKALENQHEK